MPERDANDKSAAFTQSEAPVPPLVRIAGYSRDIAIHYSLNPQTSLRLAQFGHLNYKIKQIGHDFRGTALDKTRYDIGKDDSGVGWGLTVERSTYAHFLRILKSVAFDIYSAYLSGNERSRTAAREVQNLVDDFLK